MLNRLIFVSVISISITGFSRADERRIEHRYISGRVVSVEDGDTCTVLDATGVRHRVGLYGVDAPERGQPHWDRAKEALATKIYNQNVRFDPIETDREGRRLGRVYVGERHINVEQVREGYGWHYTGHEPVKEYAAAERDARTHRRGLWNDKAPVEPWNYRRTHRAAETPRQERR